MPGRGDQPSVAGRRSRLFATCVPGLGRLVRRQLETAGGVEATGTGSDGRADIVFFETDRAGRAEVLRSRLAEQVFAEIGRADRGRSRAARAIASMAWQGDGVQRALSVWADEVRPLAGSMTFRVTARVRSEARFRRADLRRAMSDVIAADKPRWKFADPAQLEISVTEWHDGQYVAGLRLTDRSGHDRAGYRDGAGASGALPPTVAAAMVQLAGPPGPARLPAGTLLDPCCGAGAILAEALAAGWTADGSDIDASAVDAARLTAPAASVHLGDARELLMPDDCVGACVSWLPGQVGDDWQDWARAVLAELSRVTRSGGSVVLLAPIMTRPAVPGSLRLRRQVPIRLAGRPTWIWVFRRA